MSETELQMQVREKGFAAATSVVAAIFLMSLKLVIGLSTGSLGILAEAAHSALDLGAALITFFAVHVSDRPADDSHPFGHGKVENLSALAETLLLLVTCAWIVYEAMHRLFVAAVEVDPSLWAFLTMGTSIVVDYSRSRVLYRAARKYKSQALEADALHFSTDIWSSSVVIVGLALVWIGEVTGLRSVFVRADALAALGVAFIVIYVSLQLGRRTVDGLLDRAPQGLADQINAAVTELEHVQEVLRTRVRGSGSQVFVDLRVSVPSRLSFEESHAVTRQVQDAVRSIAPKADVTVHAVPSAKEEGFLERIHTVAARGHFSVHNISAHLTRGGMWIDLDLEVPADISFERAHSMATSLETELRSEIEELREDQTPAGAAGTTFRRVADVNVHIEPSARELATGSEMTVAEIGQYARAVESAVEQVPHARQCYDLDVQVVQGRVYLAFHLLVDRDLSVGVVHSLTEQVEGNLRRALPELGRVVIHAEPST